MEIGDGVGGSARFEDMITILNDLNFKIKGICYLNNDKFSIKNCKKKSDYSSKIITVPQNWPKFIKSLSIFSILYYGIKSAYKSDMIISHSPSIITGFPAAMISKILRKPLIIDHMDLNDPDTPEFIYRYSLKSANLVFAISHYLKNEVETVFKKKAVYLPVFIDTGLFKKNEKREIIRKNLGIKSEFLIGYAGSFWKIEGISVLLKAFKNIIENNDAKLIIIGGKNVPDSDDVQSLIKELSIENRVILIPRIPRNEVPDYLSACDILCSPKLDFEENRVANPAKLIEYLSMSIPTISSSVGEAVNIINDNYNGFLVKPGNIKDLEGKINWIIHNYEKSEIIAKKGRDTVKEHYSPSSTKNKIFESIMVLIN